jgi:hypothetical protein
MKKLIEQKNGLSKLQFDCKVTSLEFTDSIGGMDEKCFIDKNERGKKLNIIGKRLFRKHPVKKNRLLKISLIEDVKAPSQGEIDELLTSKNKKHKKLYEWSLVIYFKGKTYKLKMPFRKT